MAPEVIFFINCFITLLSILDPFSASISLMALTEGYGDECRSYVVNRILKAILAILITFALVGGIIFMVFGISLSALTVAGGLILAQMSFKMILWERSTAKKVEPEAASAEPVEDVAIIPLAMPLMAGPAAITAVTVFAHRAANNTEYALLYVAIILVSGLSWLILKNSHKISEFLGNTGTKVMIRVMGLVLLSMGVEFVLSGVKGYFS
ncbi:MAG: MarC family protein [Nitrospinota bacterium]|nr:MarC family protein [Nitrospinota bacterium]MDH5755463.1 MarC family protein [Nitrospinota bacterium]